MASLAQSAIEGRAPAAPALPQVTREQRGASFMGTPCAPPCPSNLPAAHLMREPAAHSLMREPKHTVELACLSGTTSDASGASARSGGGAASPGAADAVTADAAATAAAAAAPVLQPPPARMERVDSARSWASLRTASSGGSADMEALAASANEAAAGAAALHQHLSSLEAFEVDQEAPTEVKFLRASLHKKAEECEHLRNIIKELSQSRHKLQRSKVELEESFVSLQKEYVRVAKVAELARTVSAQSMSRSSRAKKELQEAQDAASRNARSADKAREHARRLRSENNELRRRVALLEQLTVAAEDCPLSASLREYIFCPHRLRLY